MLLLGSHKMDLDRWSSPPSCVGPLRPLNPILLPPQTQEKLTQTIHKKILPDSIPGAQTQNFLLGSHQHFEKIHNPGFERLPQCVRP